MGGMGGTAGRRGMEGGLGALAGGGRAAVRVEALAQALGVTKGGFYGHFADRDALLDEMLDTWERMSTDEVVERVEHKGGDIGARLRRAGPPTLSRGVPPIRPALPPRPRRDQAGAHRPRAAGNPRRHGPRPLRGA